MIILALIVVVLFSLAVACMVVMEALHRLSRSKLDLPHYAKDLHSIYYSGYHGGHSNHTTSDSGHTGGDGY